MDDLIIATYSRVYSVKGNANIVSMSPPVSYIINRIQTITQCPSNGNTSALLDCTRTLSNEKLLEILFKSIAGDYTVGSGALQQTTCKITTDPITGYLTIVDQTQENRIVLTVIIIVLFIIMGWIMYKPQWKV